jgi:ubiquinone/menaquinone biosynthesis C-methylase UbiE
MPRYFYRYIAEMAAPSGDSGRLLDIGCGNGFLLEQIAARHPSLLLFGAEPAGGLAANAFERGRGRWSIIEGSADSIPFANASFHYVTMTEVFEHMKKPCAVLREVARLLAPGGELLLTTPNMTAYEPFWRVAAQVPVRALRDPFLPWEHPLKTFQPIDTAYAFDEVRQIIADSGFEVVSIGAREFFPYLTSTLPIARRIYATVAQRPIDDLLARVVPARLGYRLVVRARPVGGD